MGLQDDINSVLAHYWGGNKMNIRQDLEENCYKAYEAKYKCFEANPHRGRTLLLYQKAAVDYGAAHAAKYDKERYGKTYEGNLQRLETRTEDTNLCWT